jgi:molecular chaperone DnaJ
MQESSKIEISWGEEVLIRDYFADLELSPSSDLEEVKRAYRRLARRFHPDLNPGDSYAHESFQKIHEAYQYLLSDEQRDQLKVHLMGVHKNFPQKTQLPTRWQREPQLQYPSEDGFLDEWNLKKNRRLEDLDIHLKVEVNAKKFPAKQCLELTRSKVCRTCRGQGGVSQSVQVTCKGCAGLSYQLIRRGAFRWKKTCDDCSGKGYQVVGACSPCGGLGKVPVQESVELEIPKDLESGQAVRYSGLGQESYDGKTKGELWITWVLKA